MNRIKYNWATLGVGVIGHQLADAMHQLGGNLYAVGNRTHEKAVKFAQEYGIEKVYDDPEEMFMDPNVDVIYISTPHNTHIQYLRQALSHGKHVLCESPITLDKQQCKELFELAQAKGCILMEAIKTAYNTAFFISYGINNNYYFNYVVTRN